jgi:hypothetical protein
MKQHLAAHTPQPTTRADLQDIIDAFTSEYNERRPHRSLPHRATPATVYTNRPKAAPGDLPAATNPGRIRTDTIDNGGSVTLRHNGIGSHEGTRILLIVEELDIRVIDATTGELLRHLTLDYQPAGKPKGPTRPA